VKVRGGGKLLGLENGNIADSETYGGNSRRVFNGRLRAYVEQDAPTRVIQIVISSAENQKVSLKPTKFEIKP
jgi:beta-galactosidase